MILSYMVLHKQSLINPRLLFWGPGLEGLQTAVLSKDDTPIYVGFEKFAMRGPGANGTTVTMIAVMH